jgi:iron complex outermembrane receptor protein
MPLAWCCVVGLPDLLLLGILSMKPRAITLAVVVALYAVPGVAADDSADLEEMIVTARRILTPGLNAETLDAADIARRRARTSDTASLLKGIPGVATQDAGGVSSLPVIRGLADDRLRTQVDGMDLAPICPNHMNPPLSYIDPTAVAMIEVYPGVSPVSVGGDSIGGSIIVRSADPRFAKPGEQLLDGEGGAHFRSIGDGWGGNLAAAYATDRLSLGYTGAYVQSDNYQAADDFKDYTFTGREGHTLPRDEVGSSAYQSTNQSVRIAWRSGGHLVDFSYSLQDLPEQGYPNQRMDMTENNSDQYNLGYTGRMDWGTLQARAYYQHTQHEMDFGPDKRFWYGPGAPPAGSGGDTAVNGAPCSPISGTRMVNGQPVGCAAGMPMMADGNNTGVSVSAAIPLADRGLVRIGGEYQALRLDDWWPPSGAGMWPYDFLNINDGQRDRYAAFGEWEIGNDRWSNIVGVRFESVSTDAGPVHGYNTNTFPTSGTGAMGNQTRDAALFNSQSRDQSDDNWDLSWITRFTPAPTQAYEVGLAQKTRSPNLYERYTWSSWQMAAFMNNTVGDGNGYFGDVNLKPEVARTLSLTADWHDAGEERWNLRVTPYYTRVDDYIDAVQWDSAANVPRAVPVVDNFTVLRYMNQDATLYGVDFSGAGRLANSARFGMFSASLVGSYARGENDDTDDHLYNIMPLHATLALTQTLGAWRNALEGEFVAARDDVSEVRNEVPTAGYGLMHLRSRYERDRWSVEVGVENVLDRYYEPPLGGAYVAQGTTMTVPPAPNQPRWGTAVPGAGRSVYAGVSLKF